MKQGVFWVLVSVIVFNSCSSNPSGSNQTEPSKYALNASINPQGSGRLTIDPEQEVYEEGTRISVRVTPSEGYILNNWQGDASLNNNPLLFTIKSDTNIIANMMLRSYSLNLEVRGEGTVSERTVTAKTDYEYGTVVELEAVPATEWELAYWDGDIEDQQNPTQLVINGLKNVEAIFEPIGISIFGDQLQDSFHSVENVLSGGFIAAGRTFPNSNRSDFIVSRLDDSGNKEWVTILGGSGFDAGIASIIETDDGGFLLVGSAKSGDGDFSSSTSQGEGDIAVIKLSSDGNIGWVKLFGGSLNDTPTKVIKTTTGGYLIVGYTDSNDGLFSGVVDPEKSSEIFLLKIDEIGEVAWIRSFGSSRVDIASGVVELNTGGYALTGFYEQNDYDFVNIGIDHSEDIFVLKTNSLGELIWVSSLKGSDTDVGRSIIENTQGDLIVGGTTASDDGDFANSIQSYQMGSYNAFLASFSSTGTIQWVNIYGGNMPKGFANDFGRDVEIAPDGSIFFVGRSSTENGDFSGYDRLYDDIFIVKTDPAGNLDWVKNYGGEHSDRAYSLALSSDGSFIVVGATASNTGIFNNLNRSEDLNLRYYDALVLSLTSSGELR